MKKKLFVSVGILSLFFTLESCSSDPTKCECQKELEKVFKTGRTTEINDKCDKLYPDGDYIYSDCN